MPVFKRNNGNPITDPITLVIGDTLKLKLDGISKNAATVMHFTIQSNVPNAVTITQKPNERQREQTITIKANQASELVTIKAYNSDGKAADCGDVATCVRPLQLKIVSKISLPAANTEAGILARLLLAESILPQDSRYGDGADVFKAMRWMRIVIENRLDPKYIRSFGNPSSPSITEIIKTRGQFEGFSGYPSLGATQQKNIDNALNIANDGTDLYFKQYRGHVEYAITLASKATADATDAPGSKLFGWMTDDGVSNPGGSFVAKPELRLGGQQFYTVTDGFLLNPNNPK